MPHRSTSCPPGHIAYIVRSGDTLESIADTVGVPTDQIQLANPAIAGRNQIQVGQKLCIPIRPRCHNGQLYTIKAGETAYEIARRNGITLYELLEHNPMFNPNYYLPGQVICIPQSKGKQKPQPGQRPVRR